MAPYILLVFLPIIVWLIRKNYRITIGDRVLCETQANSINAFMFILLLLLSFRGLPCGNDTIQYMSLFKQYSSQSVAAIWTGDAHELGFKLLCKLVGEVFNNYQVLLIVCSLMCVAPVWYFYRRESVQPLLTIALFLTVAPFVMYFSGIRQAIAMAFGIPIWYAARKKKLLIAIICVFIAIQFHTSAFMMALIYPLYSAKITTKWLWVVVPCMTAVFVFKTPIFNFLIRYLWQEYDTTPETGAITVLLLLVVLAIYAYVIPDEKLMDNDTLAMRNILLLTVVVQFFAMLHPLSMRVNYYFLIFVPVLIPKLAAYSKRKYTGIARFSVVVMTVFFIGYFFRDAIVDNDPLNIFPYIPFWESA